MSTFLPESLLVPTQNPSTLTAVQAPDQPVDDGDVALMQKVFSAAAKRPQSIPEAFMSYLQDWLQIQKLEIPIGQVQGFTQYTALSATAADFSHSVSSGQSATAAGPTISAPGTGKFIVLAGGDFTALNGTNSFSISGIFTISVNDQNSISLFKAGTWTNTSASANITSTLTVTADGGSGSHSQSISSPLIIALKYANV